MRRSNRFTDDELAKLPKWAQQKIGVLERNLEYERKRMNPDRDPETALVLLDPYAEPPIALADQAMIEFHPHGRDLGVGKGYVQVRIEDSSDGPLVSVRTEGFMGIRPNASNSIYIDSRDPRFTKGRYAK